ncbi:helix-turn-helix transcriptional regulator [Flavobacterium sp. ANB]|uniref:helix-turn-helix domain-containing protein n=1 Tax=unclassified Flavobacterium TaxID=196869 RepID=UPI0012B6F46A|nr:MULTISPECIES: AraC family transcriptional regulator [unclassified Flavobacterium]MBF4519041.1 helix-turn-helix transcriptional regulator [Flavobacterium sp. ANB]MTD71759.1 helix-turn-helix domain-containing protein [Flavobacterium sp. LC2016-13]
MANKQIILDGAVVSITDFNLTAPLIIDIKQDFPFIKIHFQLGGKMDYQPTNQNEKAIVIEEGQYNFFYLPKIDGILTLHPVVRSTVEIECGEDFIRKIFKNDFHKISGSFGIALREKISFKMWEKSESIPKVLKSVIENIIKNSQKKEVDLVYWESEIIKIFQYMFSKINDKEELNSLVYLSGIEQEQITRVETILHKNIQTSITVEELALEVGINRNKLNRNFKHIYGEPIFQYLTRIKMEKAKEILLKKGVNISEVAYEVGYKNPQHFTVAFKKYFGYTPSKLK